MLRSLLTVLLCSCVISRARFEERSEAVSRANERARVEAQRRLLAREGLSDGYGPGLLEVFSVLCSGEQERRQTEFLMSKGRLVFQPGDVERLCVNQSLVLDATLEGQPVKAHVSRPVHFARTQRGELVTYALTPKVLRRASLLVKASCDRMPSPPLQSMDVMVVQTTEATLRHFEVPYDAEALEMMCTEYTN